VRGGRVRAGLKADAAGPLRRVRRGIALGLAIALPLSLAQATTAQAAPRLTGPPPRQHDRPVPGVDVVPAARAVPRADPRALRTGPAVSWPAAGVATVPVPAAAGTRARAGSLPVWVARPAPPAGTATPAAVPAGVQVQVLDATAAQRAGVTGLLVRLARADAGTAAGRVTLGVDYSGFRHAFGGDWASRLTLYRLPECALSTPAGPGCAGTPVPAANNVKAGQVTADVDVAAAGSVFALAAAAAGSTGDFTATSLAASAVWQVSPQTGSFSWSYPLRVPPVPSGLSPALALSYDSGSVDGATASANNQPSWVGQGWDMPASFVERKYKSCADDGHAGVGDLCWGGDNLALSLNGHATTLIHDPSGKWVPKDDDGSKVEQVFPATAVNGVDRGESWKVTTTDGTQYFFGLHQLPGWTTGKAVTNSAWFVPVYGDDSGERCFNATFANASCLQAWRWNLDYVVDPKGNALAYYYAQQRNFYDKNHATTGTQYVSGGYLARAEYGLRAGHVYEVSAPAQVSFTPADRCITAPCTLPTNPAAGSHNSNWPDVPTDQSCTSATCTGKFSPTFWTSKRLASVATAIWTGTAYQNVDVWTLSQSFTPPGDGTDPALWLDSIVHAGQAAGANIVAGTATLPAVTFQAADLVNRVDGTDTLPPMVKRRIGTIINESGGEIAVTYSTPECTTASPPTPQANTKRCYPVNWTPPAQPEVNDWFHKYVVTDLVQRDRPGGAAIQQTHYDYLDGTAWHFADTDEITPLAKRTWSEWRGYSHVKVTAGNGGSGPPTVTEQRFYRGMDGDRNATGTVSVADSDGTAHTDSPGLEGFELEDQTFDGATEISRQITDPSRRTTASHLVTDTSRTVNAFMVTTGTERGRVRLASGGFRNTRVDKAYDTAGNLTQVDDQGDTSTATDDLCTRTLYASNTTKYMLAYPYQVSTVGVACSATPTFPRDAVAFTREYYDGQALGVLTGVGNVTRSESATAYSGAAPSTFVTTATTAYDTVGRVTSVKDALNRTTTSSYTTKPATVPATGTITRIGLTTQTVVTNALNQVTTTTLEPSWGSPILAVDVGGRRTEATYDALGRTREVWLPGRNKPGGYEGNRQYTYAINNDGAASYVSTRQLNGNGRYLTSYELYDGFLRPRQTQAPATPPATGRVVTDTLYDSQGRAWLTNAPYYNTGAPSGTLLSVLAANIPSAQVTDFDGAGRPRLTTLWSMGVPQWATATAYGGDRVSITPPDGGTATTTVTDARGRTTQLLQYHADTPTGPADLTSYTYTSSDQLASVTDPAGNVWRYEYDLLDRKTKDDDPDTGATTMAYDNAGQLTSQTDARGQTLAFSYDLLGRKTGEYAGSTTGTQLAGWTYDTAAGGVGMPASSTRFVGGQAYVTSILNYSRGNKGFEPDGLPYDTSVTIPAREGALAGSYEFFAGFDVIGAIDNYTMPAAGGLGEETVVSDYDDLGHQVNMQGLFTRYVSASRYTERGLLAGYTLGVGATAMNLDWSRDQATDRLTRATAVPTGQPIVADLHYSYDPAGNLTKAADTPQTGGADTQCFGYDYLRRLSEAWTPSSGECDAAPVAGALGGPAPYWTGYDYDLTGNRTAQTSHDPAGGPDTVRTSTYPAGGAPKPHGLTQVTGAGSGVGAYGYDAAGNTTSRPGPAGTQTLSYDAEGRLATITGGGQNSSVVYDADGGRLVTHDSTGSTAYLPDGMELHADTAGQVTATRYYTCGGTTIGMRTPAGVTWLATDPHGTATVSVTSAGVASVRRMDPFGNPRGAQPAWPNTRGFVGGLVDPSGLTYLGAREYDPALGRFTTIDPVIDPADPQQLNGYAYANNNPTTFSDPTGLLCTNGPDGMCHTNSGKNIPTPGVSDKQAVLGLPDLQHLQTPDQIETQNHLYVAKGRAGSQHERLIRVVKEITSIVADQLGISAGLDCILNGSISGCLQTAGALLSSAVGGLVGRFLAKYGSPWKWRAGARLVGRLWSLVRDGVDAVRGFFKARGEVTAAQAAVRRADKAAAAACSFTPETRVVMADGSSKPIAAVRVGDRVAAADPETAQPAGARTVTAVLTHPDEDLLDLTIRDHNGHTTVIHTTSNHPFYNATTHTWTPAATLDPGDHLQDLSRHATTVAAATPHPGHATMYNLTIADLHTYYIHTSVAEPLVHNQCAKPWMGEDTHAKIERDHGPTSNVPGKSKFDPGTDYSELADHAGSFPATKQASGRCQSICSAPGGKIVGVDQSGLPTNIYTTITEENGRIVTMHPGIPN